MNDGDQTLRATIEKYFGTSGSEIDSVLASVRPVHLDGGEWLFRQGDAGDSLFFLIRGRLQVWIQADGESAPSVVGEIVPGDSVGEVSLLTRAERSAGVRAIRDSELVSISRSEFEQLAIRHPTLALRLAERVATVLRDRTSRALKTGRSYRTIGVVGLGDGPRVRDFVTKLEAALATYGTVLPVRAGELGQRGAPVAALGGSDAVPQELRAWLHDQEDAHRFVVYHCDAAATPWSVFALQQCDVMLLVADAAGSVEPSDGEKQLAEATAAFHMRRILVLLQGDSTTPIEGTEAWRAPRNVDFHLHVRADRPDEVARVARILSGNAIGLVLAAGAARGFAHLGVYKAMHEAGIVADWVGGTSIGAIMGSLIAKGWTSEQMIEVCRSAFSKVNPFADYTIPLMSVLAGRRFDRMLAEHLPGTIDDMPIPFFAISCNLDSGAINVHESGSLARALRASAAMAGVMPPAVVQRSLAIDGAVINNMPIDVMQTKPVGQVIAVDLSSQKTYEVPYETLPSAWEVLRGRMFGRRHRVPTLMTLMLKATEIGTLGRVREMGKRADLLLNPPVREFGMMDIKSYDRIVDAGYRHAREALAGWRA